MSEIKATIVADSISDKGHRITTMLWTFPRHILAEVNTHKANLKTSSASSRAIPYKVMREKVVSNVFMPKAWQKAHSGMQGTEYFDGEDAEYLNESWESARDAAIIEADAIFRQGVTKQTVNRILEPYMYHTILVTATEWENFFALRVHEAAEIHMQELAGKALVAYNESEPSLLSPGEWHMPFGDRIEGDGFNSLYNSLVLPDSLAAQKEAKNMLKAKISVARCARLSYETFDNTIDFKKDLELFTKLIENKPAHASPTEHVAKCMTEWEYSNFSLNTPEETIQGYCKGFVGWAQLRYFVKGENNRDSRVIKKGI